jgi:hypothetical protein
MVATSMPFKSTPPPPPPPRARSTSGAPPKPSRVRRSFVCSDELWALFEERASALECSADWLLAEAMKRLLESGPGHDLPPLPERQGARPSMRPEPKPLKPTALPPPRPPPSHPPRPVPAAGIALVVNGSATPVRRDAFVIGRSAREAHLVLRDPGVSRQHAIIERSGTAFVIVDMASTNGVIVNGSRVARAVISPGDRVEIGPFSIKVESVCSNAPR